VTTMRAQNNLKKTSYNLPKISNDSLLKAESSKFLSFKKLMRIDFDNKISTI
jgi:hypothetical protein